MLEHGLKDLARELGLNGAVRFLGHVTPVQRAIEESLAVVVPSLGEGFGMVALEAMERARPVIAASIGGLEDLVRDGETGLLVRPGDADSLSAAMLALAADPARAVAMGREARRARDRALPGGPLHRAHGGGLPLLARRAARAARQRARPSPGHSHGGRGRLVAEPSAELSGGLLGESGRRARAST